jgi:nicotinate-nucleotide--dimethylbenzimidazole phosphoribosyltransferase
MNEEQLKQRIKEIQPVDAHSRSACMERWNSMGKPLHSLGKLESLWASLAGIQRTERPQVERRALIVMCADNGVVAEGVTQTGQEVTAIVAENFFDDLTCTSILCKKNHCDKYIVDIGMAVDTPRTIRKKIAYGTKNMVETPAMTREEAVYAIGVGMELARELKEQGYQLLATGEMGIGNTTTSSAVTSVLLHEPVEAVTGRGAGLSTEGLERKKAAIQKAIQRHQPDAEDALDVLSKVGGFDLAGLAGVFLGGAAAGLPVVADGFISLAAALVAVRLAPACLDYILPSHMSREPGARLLTSALHMEPGICMDLSLGEGSGAVALLPFLDMASEIYYGMGTFADIHVTAYEELV